ncbi:HotDog domain-containing protein [Copromyces sp. CBS 386.78]|nr:HotDog domain-containing protein [Copromyces sp. CBS 386.78]
MTIRTYHRPVKTSEVVVVSLSQDGKMAGQGQGKGSSPPPKSGGQHQPPAPPPPQSQQQQSQRQQPSRSAGAGPSNTVDPSLLKYTGEQRILELNRRELEKASSGDHDWTSSLIPHLKLLSSDPSLPHPKAFFRYIVQPQHCNRLGNLHGGCTATLFDYCTTMPLALVSKPGFWSYLGVSRTLNTTYLRPIPVGTEIFIECEVVAIGKRLATLSGKMRRAVDGALLATCEHGKFNTDPEAGGKL